MRVDRYTFDSPADPIVDRLTAAETEDKSAERSKKMWTGVGCTGAVMVFGSFFLISVLGFFAAIPIVLGLLICIPGFVIAARHGNHDLNDRKLGTARRVVSLLRADIPVAEPVSLTVDFRPYDKAGPPAEKTGSGWSGPRSERYEQTWLELKTRLADGTAVTASLVDRVSKKMKPKRKRTKTTEAWITLATVSLRLDKRYGDAATVAARLANTSPDGAWKVRSCRGQGRSLVAVLVTPRGRVVTNRSTTSSGMDDIGNADTLLRTLRWLYGGLLNRPAA
jgi:hypothetical protein